MKFLKANLDKDEMDYYIAQWIKYEQDLESLKPTEEESLHAMIMEEITVNRLEMDMKLSRDGDGAVKLNLYKELNDAKRRFAQFQESLSASRAQRLKQDGSDSILINHADYSEIGSVKTANIHSTDDGQSYLQSVDYEYDIKGVLLKINDPGTLGGDLFGMSFYYEESLTVSGESNTPLKDGKISAVQWKSKNMSQ